MWPPGRQILYFVDYSAAKAGQGVVLEVAFQERKRDGDWSKPKSRRLSRNQIESLPDPVDKQVVALLAGPRENDPYDDYDRNYNYGYESSPCTYNLSPSICPALFPQLCATGRCFLRFENEDQEWVKLNWEAEAWQFIGHLARNEETQQFELSGQLHRTGEQMPVAQPRIIVRGGLVLWDDKVATLEHGDAFQWITFLRRQNRVLIPFGQEAELLKELMKLPSLPKLKLPPELQYEEITIAPIPRVKIRKDDRMWGAPRLAGDLSFAYRDKIIEVGQQGRGHFDAAQRRMLLRDLAAEAGFEERLLQAGFKLSRYANSGRYELTPSSLPRVVRMLMAEGWHVEAEGKLYRRAGEIKIEVTSGIDWFELHGTVEFGEMTAQLPELLASLKRGESLIKLDDGTYGMLPEEWLKKYGMLAGLGTKEEDHLRFSRAQVGLLDALLASQPEASCDAVFAQARDELRRFQGIEAQDPPAAFQGELRGYQKEGLGWLHFLQKFSFGGCLADDMGLGKTVQVLALLESRRSEREMRNGTTNGRVPSPAPSLVVVPKSLVFNWKQEAAKFSPKLRVLDHTGNERIKDCSKFEEYDLVLTTYGTLRRDAIYLKDFKFDYCILDEAQAVKNSNTESAKAVRLLQGNHRLAMSGTPIENHLGELWSMFEFLNPGMLGTASVLRLGDAGARNPDPETRVLLSRALRPFILRRTKEQVAKDLPQKVEQTLYCELEPLQRKRYDELRDHYRQSLLAKIELEGMNKARIQILEALLRLRQAACHVGLIDKTKTDEASAKLDMLMPQLSEVLEEGHKALVFSQFTSFLSIVRNRLDKEKIPYEYLDGKTRDRQSCVDRFQNDPDCKLFLISLKAGGLGLNLTAAEYVFLLDPWWNPAVEAQAIDRAHRIGQTQNVFAYRLIARNTVEEKVLELQKTKRDLADAILNEDNALIRNLKREDLELLLS